MLLIPGDIFQIKKNIKMTQDIQDYLNIQLTEHQQTFNENNIRDYIDAFLSEMHRRIPERAGKDHYFECK